MINRIGVVPIDASAVAVKQVATVRGVFVGVSISHDADVPFTVHEGTSTAGALLWCGRYESAGSGAICQPPMPVAFGPTGCFVDFGGITLDFAVVLVDIT